MVARAQAALVIGLALAAAAWLVGWAGTSLITAVLGALLLLTCHAPVLGVEFLLQAAVNRADPTPKAGRLERLRAWWAECRVFAQVFFWRQPFRSRCEPDHLPAVSTGRRGIVFIHGFVCNRGFWAPWLREARRRGIPFIALDLQPVFGPIDGYVAQVETAVRRVEQATGLPPLLVCHSMGGLVARAWRASGAHELRFHRIVTIGTPHRGTWLALLSHAVNGRQMRPSGEWLQDLCAREPAGYQRFVCWYSNCDNIVFPASQATLPGADNRLVMAQGHVQLGFHEEVFAHTLESVQKT